VLESYDAALDTPIASCFQALNLGYPESLFIYTPRPRYDWLRSCQEYWNALVHPQLENPTIDPTLLDYMRSVNRAVYGTERFDHDQFSMSYERHETAVLSCFAGRPEQLLVLPICEGAGWHSLCAFLDRPIPKLPFPHKNRLQRVGGSHQLALRGRYCSASAR
jgi:hypothetical protein